MSSGYTICQNCKRPNYNVENCTNCGQNVYFIPEIIEEKADNSPKVLEDSSYTKIYKKLKNHPFFIVRIFATIIHSIVILIVGFAAFLGSLIAALAG